MSNTNESTVKQEKERINILKKYDILDTPPDGSFDRITQLAATLLHVPISIVTLVDTDRIWFKSRYGIDTNQIDRDPGLCSSAILSDDVYIVEDAVKDPRTLANPLVAGIFGLQFYAAVPLKVRGGYNLGTLCVIDKNPRQLSEADKEVLKGLADILIDQIELRLEARKAVSKQNQLLNIAAHDMKNPLTIIPLWTDLINQEKSGSEKIDQMCHKIKEASSKMIRVINDLLEAARIESSEVQLNFDKINFTDLIEGVIATNKIIAGNKNQTLNFTSQENLFVYADEQKLTVIADNLISNAIKYSTKDSTISIEIKERDNKVIMEVKDEGMGFSEEDKKYLFQRFVRLANRPTGGENSAGLGLSIVKDLVEAHHGTVRGESEGKGKGAKFTVELPGV